EGEGGVAEGVLFGGVFAARLAALRCAQRRDENQPQPRPSSRIHAAPPPWRRRLPAAGAFVFVAPARPSCGCSRPRRFRAVHSAFHIAVPLTLLAFIR